MTINQIPKFEKQNNIGIYVYYASKTCTRFTLYKLHKNQYTKNITLLLITNDEINNLNIKDSKNETIQKI